MQIKKFVTGNGHAKKDQMIRAARTILGLTTESDDEADACSVLALALYEEARPPELKLTKNAKRRSAAKKTTPRLF
jgi:Holliday junction resolvasome RuvABC endonuclease subunit